MCKLEIYKEHKKTGPTSFLITDLEELVTIKMNPEILETTRCQQKLVPLLLMLDKLLRASMEEAYIRVI